MQPGITRLGPRNIVVTATDDVYAPLALDLLRSLRALKPRAAFDIGILDLGLSEKTRTEFAPFGAAFKKPGIDIDYPGREEWEKQAPFYRAMTSRPYLRDYFPGYDAYMWMDADSWVQTADAIDTMLPAAADGDALYIASEIDRDYAPYFRGSQVWEYHLKWYRANFPEALVNQIFPRPMLNTGVLALSPRSQVWEKWAEAFTLCLRNLPQLGRENFMSEQLSLNVALHINNLPFKVMPAEFNWLTLYALPMLDEATGLYVRPTVPRGAISTIHITHNGKLRPQEVETVGGRKTERVLTFSGRAG